MSNNLSSNLSKYMRDVKTTLDRDGFTGDTSHIEPTKENRAKLIKSISPMVISLAKKRGETMSNHINLDDIVQAGNYGALVAVDRYIANHPNNTAKFSTFAWSYIRKHIHEYCLKTTSILSANLSTYQYSNKLVVQSGDEYIGDDGSKKMCRFDNIVDKSTESNNDRESIKHFIGGMFGCLEPLEKKMLFANYGIGRESMMTNIEISEKFGKSISFVNSTINNALEKCRRHAGEELPFNIEELVTAM